MVTLVPPAAGPDGGVSVSGASGSRNSNDATDCERLDAAVRLPFHTADAAAVRSEAAVEAYKFYTVCGNAILGRQRGSRAYTNQCSKK